MHLRGNGIVGKQQTWLGSSINYNAWMPMSCPHVLMKRTYRCLWLRSMTGVRGFLYQTMEVFPAMKNMTRLNRIEINHEDNLKMHV
ncbi:hypothetical protein PO909_024439 [Leuciscus waleckii]